MSATQLLIDGGALHQAAIQAPSNSKKSLSNRKTKTLKVVSMFSGCGGMDLGFRGDFSFLGETYKKLPFEVIWANDINQAACRTYKKALGEHIHCGDVWSLLPTLPTETDVLIGGFPCQDISVNGKGIGVKKGTRSGLYRAMVEGIRQTKPKIFVAENVKGLLNSNNADSLKQVLKDFKGLGYQVSYKLYQAAHYGVPQNRERVFIVGVLPGVREFVPPKPIFQEGEGIPVSRALKDLERMRENEAINHIWSRANESPDQGSRKLKADRPGQTIRAECHGNIQYHYKLPRRISMREAARIQSFPDDFIFDAKLRETERQIGNAVPPVLAWHIANAVRDCLL